MNYTQFALATSALALSVASAHAAPSINWYGFVDVGLEKYTDTGINGGADIFQGQDTPNGNSNEKQFALTNNVQSRIGLKGEEDLEDGWKGSYRLEFRANVLDDGGQALRTRLGWLGLSKGEHSIKVGAQWSPLYGYSAWNTHRSESHGHGSYFYTTDQLLGSQAYGFRDDSVISYTYGSGPYSASPFTATVALNVADDSRGNDDGLYNDSGITGVTVGTAASFGALTLNAVLVKSLVKKSDIAKAENVDLTAPSLIGFGGKFQATDVLDFGFAYRQIDRDTGKDSLRSAVEASVQYQINDKLNLHVGAATGEDEDDTQRQLDSNVYGQLVYQVTDSRHVRFEFERVDYGKSNVNGTKKDLGNAHILLFSMRQGF